MAGKKTELSQRGLKKRKPIELTGLDFGASGIKAVRLRKSRGEFTVVAADIFAPADFLNDPSPIQVPKGLLTNYTALCYAGEHAFARVINLPGSKEVPTEAMVREQLNVDAEYRAIARSLGRIPGRQEWGFLGVAVPERDVKALLAQVPEGPPAPFSLEVGAFAAFSLWFHGTSEEVREKEAVCLIEGGETVTYFAFVNQGVVCFVGKVNIGCRAMRSHIQSEMGLDDELATAILHGESIDISAGINKVCAGILRQLAVSRDFMERHHKCRISQAVVYGGAGDIPYFRAAVAESLGTELRRGDPFKGLQIESGALPEHIAEQKHRLAAAAGAALGGLMDDE